MKNVRDSSNKQRTFFMQIQLLLTVSLVLIAGVSVWAPGEAEALGGTGIADRHCGSNGYWSAYDSKENRSAAQTYVFKAGCGGKLEAGLSENIRVYWNAAKRTGDSVEIAMSGRKISGLHKGCAGCEITFS